MSTAIDISTLIVKTPETCGGRPRIAGRRMSVQHIAVLYKQGLRPEEIVQHYDHLKLVEVYAALTYYHANKDEIETYLAEEEALYQRLAKESQAGKL